MSENIEYIKNFNIGDRVKSNTSILLNRGFRDCCGTISGESPIYKGVSDTIWADCYEVMEVGE